MKEVTIMNKKISNNIIPSINFIMSSIPEDTTELEKIRYIYINLGKLFSYDYRIINDESVVEEPIDYLNNELDRYKTCYQITEILVILINGLLPSVKAKIVKRTIPGRKFKFEHVACEVLLSDGTKLLLDLTLDLANIQAGLKTKEFGFSDNIEGDYDIISLLECKKMDKKLGFIVDKYTDDYIEEFNNEIRKEDHSNKTMSEFVNYKINKAKEVLFKDFKGTHEAVRYIYNLLYKILLPEELRSLKQYNLTYSNSNDVNLMAIYSFDELGLYYSYSSELGFNRISNKAIKNLLKNGWKTNSQSIYNIFGNNERNRK